MDDNFADAPVSVGEAKANKHELAAYWTPREALISLLREIDREETVVDVMFIAIGKYETGPEGKLRTFTGFRAVGQQHYELLGLIEAAKYKLQSDA